MDLIYGKTDISRDPNVPMTLPKSLVQSIMTSWTGQLEALNIQLSLAIPYFPNVQTEDTTPPMKTILPLFVMPIFDRFLPGNNYPAYRGPLIMQDPAVNCKYTTSFPLSTKLNMPFRHTACNVTVTILVTSSSIIQGSIGFYLQRNFRRNHVTSSQNYRNIVDSANCLGVMNLATDRNITLTMSYDELYNLLDYSDLTEVNQKWTRALVAYPITPILSTTDTPTTIYFSVLYGVGVPHASGLVNAPNLAMIYKTPADQLNTTSQAPKQHSHKLLSSVDQFFGLLSKRYKLNYQPVLTDDDPK